MELFQKFIDERRLEPFKYDIGGLISHQEAEQAFKTAEQYLEKVRDVMEKTDPQLKLDL